MSRRLIIRDLIENGSFETLYTMEPIARIYAMNHLKIDPLLEQVLITAYNDHIIITEEKEISY